jgi:tetratricopeptide (TPR) repeat protein
LKPSRFPSTSMPASEPKRYDAFLSYNSQDNPAIQELARRLRAERLALYLDKWELPPGREFPPKLAEALYQSKCCVVFLGPNGLGPWQKQELQLATDIKAHDPAFHVIPVLLPGAERPRRGDVAHLEFLINASWVEFSKTLDDERAFQKLLWGITGEKPLEPDGEYADGVCPYRGLEAFRPEDAPFFFGRENLKDWLVSALRSEVRSTDGVRFLSVLGPSGSGKSSLVLAGLVPSLKKGAIEGSERWPVVIFRPGDDPLKNLAASIVAQFLPAGALPDTTQVLKLIDDLRADARTVDVFAQIALSDSPADVRLVVVVDQFEEVFTYRPQDAQARERFERARDRFFGSLLYAAAVPGGRVAVVLTMRSDFLSACAPYQQLAAMLSDHLKLVGPMSEAELREVIERPAHLVGCEVAPELTERLLRDVNRQPGGLPLLQFALKEIWNKRDVRKLTLQAYTELGKDERGQERGIEGVLDHRADQIYSGLTPEDQDLCRRLFLRLVQPGEGTDDTKRRVSYNELLPYNPTRAHAVLRLVQTLASSEARLITTEATATNDAEVEVAHEALIRGWSRLRRWIDADREGLRTHQRLTDSAREWDSKGRPRDDFLERGTRLLAAREWADSHRDEMSAQERSFLAASLRSEHRTKTDKLADARRIAAEARAKVVQEQRARRLTVALAGSIVTFVLLSVGAWVWALREEQDRLAKWTSSVLNALDETDRIKVEAQVKKDPRLWDVAYAAARRADDLLKSGAGAPELTQRVAATLTEIKGRRDTAQQALDAVKRGTVVEYYHTMQKDKRLNGKDRKVIDDEKPNLLTGSELAIYSSLREKGLTDEEIAKANMKPEDGLVTLGSAVLQRGEVDSAIQIFQKAVELKSDFAEAHSHLGVALRMKGLTDEAIKALRKAIELKPDFAEAHTNLGNALLQKGQMDEAIDAYRKAIKRKPDDATAHSNLGIVLLQKGQVDEAIAALFEAIELDPNLAEAHGNLGDALRRKERTVEAIAAWRRAIKLKPDYAEVYLHLGITLARMDRVEEAIAVFRKAIETKPNFAPAHANLGACMVQKGQIDEAIASLRKAIALDSNHAEAHYYLGIALGRKDQLDEAIAEYRRAIELKPNFDKAYEMLDSALQNPSQTDEGVVIYNELLNIHKNPYAYYYMGLAFQRNGQFTEALAAMTRADELGKGIPAWPYPSAQMCQVFRQFVELDSKLAKVLRGEIQPTSAKERIQLAGLCYAKKMYAIAARFFEKAFAMQPDLAENLEGAMRYAAASSAAMGGNGQGKDNPPPDDATRAGLRKQALAWLRADLTSLAKRLENKPAEARPLIQDRLKKMQIDRMLASLRDHAALAKLPDAERAACRAFWADVDALLKRSLEENR